MGFVLATVSREENHFSSVRELLDHYEKTNK